MTALPEFLIPILGKIADREGFVDFSTEIDSGTNIGDNFMSQLLRIVVTGHRKPANGSNVVDKLHLLCKLMPENAEQRAVNQSEQTFYRESYFYTKIVPQFTKFQTDRALSDADQFKSFPKCYEVFTDRDSGVFAIIIEDLRPKDFAMWPKEKPMPIDYLSATLRELAKFHAVSMALKDQQPDQFAEHKKLTDLTEAYLSSEILCTMFWESYQRVINVLKDEEHKTVMRDIQQNYKKYFQACKNEVVSDRFGVVGHGDFWNNNILFRTSKMTKNVEEVCLVDFQDIHYVSPTVDLLNIIFTATDKITRKHHFRDLLRTYYDQLTNNLRKLGSDPEELFPYGAFINELKECGNYAFLISPLMVQLCMVESNDEQNSNGTSDHSAQNGMEFHAVKGISERYQQLFSERMCDCVDDLVKFGYYRKS